MLVEEELELKSKNLTDKQLLSKLFFYFRFINEYKIRVRFSKENKDYFSEQTKELTYFYLL